jgi:proline dehydrogenase
MLANFIRWLATKKSLTDAIARHGMRQGFARRFVAGESLDEAISASSKLARAGCRVTLNHLGENVGTIDEARTSRDSYITTVERLKDAGLDGNISIKLTQLGLDLDRELCLSLAQDIAARAACLQGTIEIDMEGSAYTEATLEIYETVQRRYGNVAIAIQAYLRRSLSDMDRLAALDNSKVRLVKGAYREPAAIAFQKKAEVDANYCRLLDRAFSRNASGCLSVAIASHDPAIITYAERKIAEHRPARERYEFQMLLGIRRDLQENLLREGHPLRIYVPWGTAWCPYFMRRLAERPANIRFVLQSLLSEKTTARQPSR